jgi:hypothetical protein
LTERAAVVKRHSGLLDAVECIALSIALADLHFSRNSGAPNPVKCWVDENGMAPIGLHVSFKLSASGETVYLADTDANLNIVLDSVTFGLQETDRSYGRTSADPSRFEIMQPTPGQPNN